MMRVITGDARGRKLKSVEGLATRPTTERTKQSVFNAIQFDIEGRRVLDLFAGTGQLGIEALSRGAADAVFVDLAPAAIAVIRDNVKTVRYENRSEIVQGDALGVLARFPEDDSLTGLMSALGEGDMQTAFSCAHALKGLSAQLGILCVSEAASRVCELLRPLDPSVLGDAREAAKTLCALHAQVCREIAQLPAR